MAVDGSAPAEKLEFDSRYFVQTAKNSIESTLQILEEAISNEDEAISRRAKRDGGEDRGTITVAYSPETRMLTVTGDGDGMTAETMRARLKVVGASPQQEAKRGFFHRGIREVFLAMGGGEVTSIGLDDDGRQLLSVAVFADEPEMKFQIEDAEANPEQRAVLGLEGTGTSVRIPVARFATKKPTSFEFPALERQIRHCVGLRPVLADPNREVILQYADASPKRLVFNYPEGEDLVALREVEVAGQKGTLWVGVAEKQIKRSPSKRARVNGILVRGERAAYEATLGDRVASHPAMGRIFGELRIDGIEEIQRAADDDSQLVYKPDRSGLNSEHSLVEEIMALIDETLEPLITELDAKETKSAATPDMRRELQKLARVINEAVDGSAPTGFEDSEGEEAKEVETSGDPPQPPAPPESFVRELDQPIDFPLARAFVLAGQTRTVQVWFNSEVVGEGTPIALGFSPSEILGSATLSSDAVPAPAEDGVSQLTLTMKGGNSEGRDEVVVRAGGHEATLPVHVRFPRASGFISQILPKDVDWATGSAIWHPSSGIVEVFIGRPEFKDAEARAHRGGTSEAWKYPEYRQLVVESVREAALWEAARRRAEVEWDEMSPEDRSDRDSFHKLVQFEFQELDYLLRAKLLRAFAQS